MIRYYANANGLLVELEEPEAGCWINLTPPFSPKELEDFAQKLLIPLDFLTDPLDIDERTRYEREDDVRLIVINTPVVNANFNDGDPTYITVPIGLIITIDHLVTISGFENPVIDRFLSGRVKNFDPTDEKLFILQIFEQNSQRFLLGLKKLNHRRSTIEKELYDSTTDNVEIKQLLSIEKALVYFVNALNANQLLMMKIKRIDFLHIKSDEDKEELLEDIIVDNDQALEMAKIYTSILGGTMNAYHSIVSNNLNAVMKRLTTITIVLMVPTLIASFFGMNVTIPFSSENASSFYIICLISIGLSAATSWFFRKQF